ncbi:hypothetical protein CAD93_18955 [Salmonella enterica subsp. enterica serovar Tennessee]|nr:hypothetical protein [Salmonella enterica subsp. enterica serovar Tennessee]
MMNKAAITNGAIRTRIEALRNTSANVIASTAKCDAEAFEELLKLREAMKTTRVRVLQGDACDCNDSCDCVPPLYVAVNGLQGHGQAFWTYRDDGKPGLAYWCEFMGLVPFWADDHTHATDLLREKLAWLGDKVEVRTW